MGPKWIQNRLTQKSCISFGDEKNVKLKILADRFREISSPLLAILTNFRSFQSKKKCFLILQETLNKKDLDKFSDTKRQN